jgi:hypothetical protein
MHQINIVRGEPWQQDFRIPALALILVAAADRATF